MNDLDLVRELRADVPSPTSARLAPGRARLLASISRPSRPRKLWRAIRPAGAAAAAAAIEAAGRSSSCRSARPRSAVRRTARRRVWVSVVAAAATIAVACGALMLAPGGSQHAATRLAVPRHSPPRPTSHPAGPVAPVYHKASLTAAVVLGNAAAAAARQDHATGKYVFTESEGIGGVGITRLPGMTVRVGPSLSRSWFGNGVDGRLIQAMVIPGFPSIPRNRITALSPASEGAGLTWAQMQALPTAQAKLLAIVARLAPENYPEPAMHDPLTIEEFGYIGQLLWGNPIPPAVQAALYRVAAKLPGIKVIDTTDLVGRPAIEVYLWDRAMLFSPVSFQLLGEATIDPANVSCPVEGSGAILATGYVGSDTQLPAGTPTKLEPAYYSNSAPGCPRLLASFPPRVLRQILERRERHLRHR
jgi:hypothetical protein